MATRQPSGAQRTLGLFVAIVVGAVFAAYLFPIAIDTWTTEFATGSFSGTGQTLIDIGDVVLKLSLFLFLTAVAIKVGRRR